MTRYDDMIKNVYNIHAVLTTSMGNKILVIAESSDAKNPGTRLF